MKTRSKMFFALGLVFALGLFFLSSDSYAQQNKGKKAGTGFVDLNGDGINDRAIDSDGDGILNCLDPDFVRPMDGSGNKFMKGSKSNFGNGGFNSGNTSGNQGIGPKVGTGYGAGTGTGICDGTGPKGNAQRGGRK